MSQNKPTFQEWWKTTGSLPPEPGEDHEEHCKRICFEAWIGGFERCETVIMKVLEEENGSQ
jgi:hypothetical protein